MYQICLIIESIQKIMLKKSILLLCLSFSFFVQTANAQTPKELEARSEYLAAETAYNAANYNSAVQHLNEAVKILGATNPKIQYLIVKSFYNSERYEETKTALDTYFSITDGAKADPEKYNEMVRLIAENKEKLRQITAEKQQKEEARIAKIAKMHSDSIKHRRDDSLIVVQQAARKEAYKPIKEWGGFTWGFYVHGGLAIPFNTNANIPRATVFERWCKDDMLNITRGSSFEIGTSALFPLHNNNNLRLGFDWTMFNITTFGQSKPFIYNGPTGNVNISTTAISLLSTQIGPVLGFRLASGMTVRAAYQLSLSAIAGGYTPAGSSHSSSYTGNISLQKNPELLLHAYSLTFKYRPLTLSAKYMNGLATANYNLFVADNSPYIGYTHKEAQTAYFDMNTLIVTLGLSF